MRSRGESGRSAIGVHASLSAGNLRATLIEHRRRFPEVHNHLVDGSSNDLISNLANSNIDVAFVAGDHATWDAGRYPSGANVLSTTDCCCRSRDPVRNFSSFSLAKSGAPSDVAFFAMTWRLTGFSPLSEPAGAAWWRWKARRA
jgi:hypothetical protein